MIIKILWNVIILVGLLISGLIVAFNIIYFEKCFGQSGLWLGLIIGFSLVWLCWSKYIAWIIKLFIAKFGYDAIKSWRIKNIATSSSLAKIIDRVIHELYQSK